MPFGLINALTTFQALVNDVLRDHLNISVLVYLDNILIYSKTKEQYIKDITWVLEKLK